MGSTAPTPVFAAGDAELLMSGKERVGQSAWMLREGVGEILLYLATRSVHIGVIASPQTTPIEFDNFIEQLRIQSTRIRATISPLTVSEEGMETGLAKAYADLDVKRTSAVLVVGSTEAILCAANAAEMFTARYNSPNSMREGVIQSFTVRHINEVRWVMQECTYVRQHSTARLMTDPERSTLVGVFPRAAVLFHAHHVVLLPLRSLLDPKGSRRTELCDKLAPSTTFVL